MRKEYPEKMKEIQYDVLIIGGGPAGYYCGMYCSKGGLKVALVEKEKLGGTGLRWGCLPVKKILDNLKTLHRFKKLTHDALSREIKEKVLLDNDKEMIKIEEWMSRNLKERRVDLYFGEGAFLDPHTYVVKEKQIKAKYIVIATGTSPDGIKGIEIDGKSIITHKEAVNLTELPESIMIIGGNVEGCEFATLFAELGVKVVVVEKEKLLLQGYDRDLLQPLEAYFRKQDVTLYVGVGAKKIKGCQGKVVNIVLEDDREIHVEKVLVTGARKPNFPIGLAEVGVQLEKDRIIVDKNLRTTVPNIYAIGDINGIQGMAHAAIQQGIAVAEKILFNKEVAMTYHNLPRGIFTVPEIAGAGYQEFELVAKGISYRKGICNFADTWRGFSKNIQEGFVKVLVGKDDKLLGLWMVGEDVSEYIGLMGVLIHKEVTVKDIKENLMIHPTLNEAVLEAVLNLD